ncbi:MAG: SH3 domain-containing protein [Bdellovibrionales bacterium]|nr:SH3 domain-containing protein [Bdellovibrionales bacterium]
MAGETQSPQEVFDLGAKLLAEGKSVEAIEHFKAIADQGVTSDDLEANWGRALVDNGKPGEGILHLMNSVYLDRFNSSHRADLALAQTKVESQMGTALSHPAEWANRVGSWIHPLEALSLASCCLVALIIAKAASPRMNFKRMSGFLLAALIFCALGGFAQYGRSVGVVLASTELRAAPLPASESVQSLLAGTRLRIIRLSGEFAEVERPGSFRGWVRKDSLAQSPY